MTNTNAGSAATPRSSVGFSACSFVSYPPMRRSTSSGLASSDWNAITMSSSPNRRYAPSVELTDRYQTDRMRPDRAIDALDEACAHAHAIAEYSERAQELIRRRRALAAARPDERDRNGSSRVPSPWTTRWTVSIPRTIPLSEWRETASPRSSGSAPRSRRSSFHRSTCESRRPPRRTAPRRRLHRERPTSRGARARRTSIARGARRRAASRTR